MKLPQSLICVKTNVSLVASDIAIQIQNKLEEAEKRIIL